MKIKTPESLAQALSGAGGENLVSVVIFGSAASGNAASGFSDVNLVVVLNDLSPAALERIAPPLRAWRAGGQPAPALFTPRELNEAADVFPIEFMDIREARRTIFGKDLFEDVRPKPSNLRHQLEYELRSKALALRAAYVASNGKARDIAPLLGKALATFSTLFRAVLRLVNEPAPGDWPSVWKAVAAHAAVDVAALEAIADVRARRGAPANASDLLARLLSSADAVIDFVNRRTIA